MKYSMNHFRSFKASLLGIGIFFVASIFLILPTSTLAAGKVWEASWGISPNNEEVTFLAPDITSSSRVYAVAHNSRWVLYNMNGTMISSSSLVSNPREVEVVGSNYYVAYSTTGQLTARKLDSSLNTLQIYTYSSTTWPTLLTRDVTVDSSNNVYVVGQAVSVSLGYKWIVVKFNNAGVMQWVHISDFGGSHDAEIAHNAQAIGSYVYVIGTYSANGTTPRQWVGKYSATSTTPITSYLNSNAGGNGDCEATTYNNLPYSICNTGYVYSVSSSTGAMAQIISAIPSSGCNTLAGARPVYVSSTSGLVYTAGGCNTLSGTARTYFSRFNLATATSTGPFFLQPFIAVDSYPTDLGSAIFAENGNYGFVGGTTGPTSGVPQQDNALWRVSMLICTGPISFGPWTNDDPVISNGGAVRASHINDMRTRVNALRTDAGLATSTWTDGPTVSAGVAVKAQHFSEIRTRLSEVFSTCGQTEPYTYSSSSFTVGTPILVSDANFLRLNINSAP